jgi:hypothetical protein
MPPAGGGGGCAGAAFLALSDATGACAPRAAAITAAFLAIPLCTPIVLWVSVRKSRRERRCCRACMSAVNTGLFERKETCVVTEKWPSQKVSTCFE